MLAMAALSCALPGMRCLGTIFTLVVHCCLLQLREAWRQVPRTSRGALASLLLGLSQGSCAVHASPLGNIDAALQAIRRNPEALTCNLDNQNVKDGQSSCQQLDEVVRWRAGRLLTIRQDWGGSASTGSAIWNGANVATWYLENTLGSAALRGKSVVELGAGVGFTSLVANALGASEVVITDGNEDVLHLADKNIGINVEPAGVAGEGGVGVRTALLRWNTADETPLLVTAKQQPWDFIIASDVTYKKAAWGDLVACIDHLSGPGTQAIVSMEPRNVGEIEGVLGEFAKHGFSWREERLPVDADKTLCAPFCARLFVLTKANLF